jgi:hypothetical protein
VRETELHLAHVEVPACTASTPMPRSLPRARRHLPAGERHRRLRPRQVHRLRLLHHRLPSTFEALARDAESLQVHALLRPHSVGLEPACIKACPTNCLSVRPATTCGSRTRAQALRADGKRRGRLQPPVGQTSSCPRTPPARGLRLPGIRRSWQVRLWKGPLKWVETRSGGRSSRAFLHYLRYGPREVEQ